MRALRYGLLVAVIAAGVALAQTTVRGPIVFSSLFAVLSNGQVSLGLTAGHIEIPGSNPSLGSNCGAGATPAGNDVVGRVTLGTSPGSYCTVTFVTGWTQPPVCSVWNETSGARQVWPQPSTTALAILPQSGSLTAADTLAYRCASYR